uniref:Ovule protein n=1 Tax=Strongyloides venezuelensis TaxID=75913 RepID=A0A0K0G5W2_STRVS
MFSFSESTPVCPPILLKSETFLSNLRVPWESSLNFRSTFIGKSHDWPPYKIILWPIRYDTTVAMIAQLGER